MVSTFMITMFTLISILLAIFGFVSYHAIVNGHAWATWATGICLWLLSVSMIAMLMFG